MQTNDEFVETYKFSVIKSFLRGYTRMKHANTIQKMKYINKYVRNFIYISIGPSSFFLVYLCFQKQNSQ